jgi:hypothetical protein
VIEQLDLLKSGCKKGYQSACGQLASVERLRSVEIAMAECPCARELAFFEKRCGHPEIPWRAPRISSMDEHGRVDQSIPSSLMAIDRRATVRDVLTLLESGSPAPPRAKQILDPRNREPSLEPVLIRRDGTAVSLPHLRLAREAACRDRTLVHHYSLSGNELRDGAVEEKTCPPMTATADPRSNHVFDFPDDASWGIAIQKLCNTACGDEEARGFSLLAK